MKWYPGGGEVFARVIFKIRTRRKHYPYFGLLLSPDGAEWFLGFFEV